MNKTDAYNQGWCDAIDAVRESLRNFPGAGGDTEIINHVERIAEDYARRKMLQKYQAERRLPNYSAFAGHKP